MEEDRNKESEREEHVHTRVFLTLHRTSTRKRECERVENMIQKKLIWRCAYSTQPDATSFGAYFGVDTHIYFWMNPYRRMMYDATPNTTAAPSQWAAFDCDMFTTTTNFRPEPTQRSLSVIFGLITTHLILANGIFFVQ